MTRNSQPKPNNSEAIKSHLKARMAERIDKLFAGLPEHSSLAEIEKVLLKESPELTSEMFQALVDRQDFSPSHGTSSKARTLQKRTEEK
jgi:hypothetical protein